MFDYPKGNNVALGNQVDRNKDGVADTVQVTDGDRTFTAPVVDPGPHSPVYAIPVPKPQKERTPAEMVDVFRFQMAKGDPKVWWKIALQRLLLVLALFGMAGGGAWLSGGLDARDSASARYLRAIIEARGNDVFTPQELRAAQRAVQKDTGEWVESAP